MMNVQQDTVDKKMVHVEIAVPLSTFSRRSWFAGNCKDCFWNVVYCADSVKDYFAYCSNPRCEHHSGEDVYDTDELSF